MGLVREQELPQKGLLQSEVFDWLTVVAEVAWVVLGSHMVNYMSPFEVARVAVEQCVLHTVLEARFEHLENMDMDLALTLGHSMAAGMVLEVPSFHAEDHASCETADQLDKFAEDIVHVSAVVG